MKMTSCLKQQVVAIVNNIFSILQYGCVIFQISLNTVINNLAYSGNTDASYIEIHYSEIFENGFNDMARSNACIYSFAPYAI